MLVTFFKKRDVEKYGRARKVTDKNITRRMRCACYISKAINTHSDYVIRFAFPLQQWSRERAEMLCLYINVACDVIHKPSAGQ